MRVRPRRPYRSGMGTYLAWTLFAAINAGIVWCLWVLAREACRHATWHISARRERRAEQHGRPALEFPPGFRIVPAQRRPGQPEPAVLRLRRVS
jgi:hypothetical protein